MNRFLTILALTGALAASAAPTQWIPLGTAQLTEEILADVYSCPAQTYTVTVETDAAQSGWYRVVNPMAANPYISGRFSDDLLSDRDYYLTINATNPDAVSIADGEIGVSDEDGRYSVMSFPLGKLDGRIITFDSAGDIILMQDDYEYDANMNGAFRLELPEQQVAPDPVTLPYINALNTDGALDGFTILDVNGDGITWKQDSFLKTTGISYNSDMPMDDWLIMPPVELAAGMKYPFSIDVLTGDSGTDELFEVKAGTAPTAEAMTLAVIERTDAAHSMYRTYTGTIQPETDGTYYIGIHAVSVPDTYSITLRDLSVGEAMLPAAPAAPADFNVVTRTNGFLGADVTMTAPTTDLDGNALDALTYIRFYRDGTLCHSVMNPRPGQQISFVTEVPANGRYDFSAIAENSNGQSPAAEINAFVGVLEPAAPASVTLTEGTEPGTVTLTWDAVTADIRGNELLPEYVTYRVYTTGDDSTRLLDNLTEPTCTFSAYEPGAQQFLSYDVVAVNAGGMSDFTRSDLLHVGEPYAVPFSESFAGGNCLMLFANIDGHEAKWNTYTDDTDITAQDNDGGFLASEAHFIDDTAGMITGKFDLSGLEKPALAFWTYKLTQDGQNGNSLTVSADGQTVADIELDNIEGADGWYQVVADLSALKGKTVQFTFESHHKVAPVVIIDNMQIGEADQVGVTPVIAGNDEGAPVYYDLQGRRIDTPAPGSVVITLIGSRASKTVAR